MRISPGTRLGSYEIQSVIGAGGMGEVYRARDTRLGRDVAIKVLPELFLSDPDRLARFEREARALAALNHPHIAAIYGVEDAGDLRGLVLELVEGQTLADRLRSGPLSVPEALAIASQIADALDAAHERGIIHRDLKPANIKLTPDGTVKLLDFGLARLSRDERMGPDVEQAITETGTREGTVLGTSGYMSPEQARGQSTDRRTDVWAFGCVLFEMLGGHRPFSGNTATDIIAAVIEREPDWTRLPEETPPGIRRLLRRCLNKDVKQRLRDFGDIRLELADKQDDEAAGPTSRRTDRRAIGVWVSASLATVALVAVAAMWLFSRAVTSSSVIRATITMPRELELDTSPGAAPIALSADGQQLAFVAFTKGRGLLYVRDIGAFEARPLPGTEGARYPFFSPDGQWIGFFADAKLKRISLSGGAAVPICDASGTGRGGTWGSDGTIIFDPGASGLMRVAAMGGAPHRVTSRDTVMDAQNLSWPHFLPEARSVLVTVGPEVIAEGMPSLAVLSLESGDWHPIGPGSQAQYVESGHILYHAVHAREGQVDAVAFDAKRFAVRGSSITVVDGVFRARNGGAAYFAAAGMKTLVFAPGGLSHTLVRVDRHGRYTPLFDDHRGFRFPRVSPDGSRIAVTIDPRPSQVWIYDVGRRSSIPLATNGHSMDALWTPDGQRVTYMSGGDLFWRAANAGAPAERLLAHDRPQYPSTWTADGSTLIFEHDSAVNKFDLWQMVPGGDPRSLLANPADEKNARLSPDNRWLAHMSDESGRAEVYVRPFPNVNEDKWMISTAGGHSPVWSHDGRSLFYMSGTAVFEVRVESRGSTLVASAPELLFSGPFDTTQDENYDVFPDGHFVMVEADPHSRPTHLQLVLNWLDDLRRRVPRF